MSDKQYALRLLSQRALLTSELREKLMRRGADPLEIEKIISTCQEKGYLNDQMRTQQLVARAREQGKSNKEIFYKLSKKGIDLEALEQGLTEEGEDGSLERHLHKYAKKGDLQERDYKQKVVAKLYKKGFALRKILDFLGSME